MMKFRYVLALVATIGAINASSAEPQSIILASTTSVEASGLLANILPQFTATSGIKVNVVAQSTGKALDTARRGDADLLLVHDREAERLASSIPGVASLAILTRIELPLKPGLTVRPPKSLIVTFANLRHPVQVCGEMDALPAAC